MKQAILNKKINQIFFSSEKLVKALADDEGWVVLEDLCKEICLKKYCNGECDCPLTDKNNKNFGRHLTYCLKNNNGTDIVKNK